LLGKDSPNNGPPVKFPYMGADPVQKDIFVEMDWQTTANGAKQLTGTDAETVAADFLPAGVKVHMDIGVTNTNPNTWQTWGNWGGAQALANNASRCQPQDLSSERAGPTTAPTTTSAIC